MHKRGRFERELAGLDSREYEDTAPTSPFPPKFADPLTFNTTTFNRPIERAFFKALNDVPLQPGEAIAIVTLDSDSSPVVGQNEFEMHYSGSLLKAAAMYAAFQLHRAVNDFGRPLSEFKAKFDSRIRNAASRIPAGLRIAPKYNAIFTAARDFTPDFNGHISAMVRFSSEDSAGAVIRALGYPWINGVLQSAGFFNDPNGIWLAGDYQQMTTVTVPVVNDKVSKQAMTCIDMARLFVLLQRDRLITDSDGSRNRRMKELLAAAFGSYLKRFHLDVVAHKIGRGQLKKGPDGGPGSCNGPGRGCVLSEASVVKHRSGHLFVTVWQNVLHESDDAGVKRMATIIQKTMDNYA